MGIIATAALGLGTFRPIPTNEYLVFRPHDGIQLPILLYCARALSFS